MTFRLCDNAEPHERHEHIVGVTRWDCPGIKPSPTVQQLAKIIQKAAIREVGKSPLWIRVYDAIANGDEDELASIRSEFGSREALAAALVEEPR